MHYTDERYFVFSAIQVWSREVVWMENVPAIPKYFVLIFVISHLKDFFASQQTLELMNKVTITKQLAKTFFGERAAEGYFLVINGRYR